MSAAAGEKEPEPPTGLPEEGAAEDIPMGVPPDDEDAERELPGFPEGDIDTAG
jgi:hypothetical protein